MFSYSTINEDEVYHYVSLFVNVDINIAMISDKLHIFYQFIIFLDFFPGKVEKHRDSNFWWTWNGKTPQSYLNKNSRGKIPMNHATSSKNSCSFSKVGNSGVSSGGTCFFQCENYRPTLQVTKRDHFMSAASQKTSRRISFSSTKIYSLAEITTAKKTGKQLCFLKGTSGDTRWRER